MSSRTKLLSDYSGPFDPELTLASLGRQPLAHLGREYLLNGHLQDRVGLPLVAKHFGVEAYARFSIEEWMAREPDLLVAYAARHELRSATTSRPSSRTCSSTSARLTSSWTFSFASTVPTTASSGCPTAAP